MICSVPSRAIVGTYRRGVSENSVRRTLILNLKAQLRRIVVREGKLVIEICGLHKLEFGVMRMGQDQGLILVPIHPKKPVAHQMLPGY